MWRKISWTDGRMDRRKTVYPPSPFEQWGYKKCDEKRAYMFNVYKNQQNRQTGSRNLMGPKTFPAIWGTYMKLVTKYQISAINSCWEKCDEKYAYMFNVYKNQLSRQTGSRNLMGPNTLPTIWYTYMMLVTKYQISAINSYWEKCDEKYLGRTEGWTDVKQYTPPPPSVRGGIKNATENEHICSMCIKINKVGKQEVGIWWVQKCFPRYGVPIWSLWPNIRSLPSTVTEKSAPKNILDGQKNGRTEGQTEVKQYTPLPLRGAGV
jgi:ribosomal protein L37AE/L43A